MGSLDQFSELDALQDEIRSALRDLGQTVTTIVGLPDVPERGKQGHVEREIVAAKSRLTKLRLQEQMLLDQVEAQVASQAQPDDTPVWAGRTNGVRVPGAPTSQELTEALLTEVVKANVLEVWGDAPGPVLVCRLRSAIVKKDRATEAAIRDIVLRRVVRTGEVRQSPPQTLTPANYLLRLELGAVYQGYDEELEPLLTLLADAEQARLSNQAKGARSLVLLGAHQRKPVDLGLVAGEDRLLRTLVEKLEDT